MYDKGAMVKKTKRYKKSQNPLNQPSGFNLGGEKGNYVDTKKKNWKKMRY